MDCESGLRKAHACSHALGKEYLGISLCVREAKQSGCVEQSTRAHEVLEVASIEGFPCQYRAEQDHESVRSSVSQNLERRDRLEGADNWNAPMKDIALDDLSASWCAV